MTAQQQARALQTAIVRRMARDGLPVRSAREALADSLQADVIRAIRQLTHNTRSPASRTREGDDHA